MLPLTLPQALSLTGDEEPPAAIDRPIDTTTTRVLVFVVYKKEATHVARGLLDKGFAAEALQGDMSQRKRYAQASVSCSW